MNTITNPEALLRELLSVSEIRKSAVRAPTALNEAPQYGSAFSRGMKVEIGNLVVVVISGTASIDEHGESIHIGDFRAQVRRVFQNITDLLAAESATWKDVVRTGCFFRDIDRDYAAFNEERNAFFAAQGIEPYPASLGIEARLCRPELLFEMEALAILVRKPA